MIAISSPAAGDGKTVTAINLAGALARGSDEPVLLIDADLRRPSVARLFGIRDTAPGLADVLCDREVGLAQVVQTHRRRSTFRSFRRAKRAAASARFCGRRA